MMAHEEFRRLDMSPGAPRHPYSVTEKILAGTMRDPIRRE
jgi:hypothetical protein